MIKLLMFCGCLLFCINAWSQDVKWRYIDQPYYGMKYKLPDTWEVDGFGGDDDWDDYGSSVCGCSGTINIGGRYSDEELFMVAYPSRNKDSITSGERLFVWNMEFDPNGTKSKQSFKKVSFQKTVSKWKPESLREQKDNEVWRFTTSYKNQYYVIYFWGTPAVMKKNADLIHEILSSFKPVKT